MISGLCVCLCVCVCVCVCVCIHTMYIKIDKMADPNPDWSSACINGTLLAQSCVIVC